MHLITFPSGADWFKANWVFRLLADDVICHYPDNAKLKFVLEQAEALGGLALEAMEPDEAASVLKAIDEVVDGTINGTINGWRGKLSHDPDGQRMYLASLSELRVLISEQQR